ncbi:MAG TPA: hypothetical protein VHA82_24585 [Ramlibacter sp.]|uniref:hypothetical protein n=1 Tax=Ramlibacter sp. TaxID=1917967 RepID=UPI002C836CFD|nr:hypothetical protein [Ramlibacter sp.]HVZ47008.1 hypothetical protein [Ramlibacter sp.]
MIVTDIVRDWGKVAGVAGMGMTVFLLIIRQIVQKLDLPRFPVRQATYILTLVIVLTFGIAVIGIGAWLFTQSDSNRQKAEIFDMLVGQAQAATVTGGAAPSAREKYARDSLPQQKERFNAVLRDMRALLREQQAGARQIDDIEASLEKGDASVAIRQLREIAASHEASAARARTIAADMLEFSGRFEEALDEYSRAADAQPGNEKALDSAVGLALNIGRHDIADALIQRHEDNARASGSDDYVLAHYVGLRAISLWFQGRNRESKEAFDAALPVLARRRSEFLAQLLNDSVALYDSIGQFDVARQRAAQAENLWRCLAGERSERTRIAQYNLSAELIREGRYSAARQVFETAFRLPAENWNSRFRRVVLEGHVAFHQGNWAAAERSYSDARQILAQQRHTGEYRYLRVLRFLGEALIAQGAQQRSEAVLQEAFSMAQRISGRAAQETLYLQALLGLVDANGEHARLALPALELAQASFPEESRHSPEYAAVLETEAKVLWAAANRPRAIEQLRTSCAIYAANTSAAQDPTVRCYERLQGYLRALPDTRQAASVETSIANARSAAAAKAREGVTGIQSACTA